MATAKENTKRLQIYLEKCRRDADAKGLDQHRKAFFMREVARTEARLAKLTT